MQHAKLSSSQLSRIDKCVPSIHSDGSSSDSEYSTEGTLFAEHAENVLNHDVAIENCPTEFQNHLREYQELVRDQVGNNPRIEYVEKRLGNDEEGGTPDYAAIHADDPALGIIIDIKYGVGVDVQAEGNLQLLDYAYQLQQEFPGLSKFKLIIFQPRSYKSDSPIKIADVDGQTVAEMGAFRKTLKARVTELEIFGESDLDFVEGDHCQFCPRVLSCPKKIQPTTTALTTIGESKDVSTFNEQQIYYLVENRSRIAKVLKVAEDYVRNNLKAGKLTPEQCGMKLIESKGNRCWKEDVEKRLMRNFRKSNTHETKLRSPPQLEKQLKSEGLFDDKAKNTFEACIMQPKTEKLVNINAKGDHKYTNANDFELLEAQPIETKSMEKK